MKVSDSNVNYGRYVNEYQLRYRFNNFLIVKLKHTQLLLRLSHLLCFIFSTTADPLVYIHQLLAIIVHLHEPPCVRVSDPDPVFLPRSESGFQIPV